MKKTLCLLTSLATVASAQVAVFCLLLSPFPLQAAEKTLPTDPASYILTLRTISKGDWQLAKEINASRELTFTVPRIKGDPISCTYKPLTLTPTPTLTPTLTPTPIPRGGTALTLGTVSCPGFSLSNFEKTNLQYEEAQFIESPIMLPSHDAWLTATGQATHLLYDRDITNTITSFRITFRKRPIVQEKSPVEIIEQNLQEQNEELKRKEEETQQELLAPDRRGKIDRKNANKKEATENVSEEKRGLQKTNICSGLLSDEYKTCIRSMRTRRFEYHSSQQSVDTAPVPGQPSRRAQALEERLQNKMSPLLDKNTGGRINLESLSTQIRRRIQERLHSANTDGASEAATTEPSPVIRKRATSSHDRKMGNNAPLCRSRVGIDLIECLQGLGVEISERTVDPHTLKVFEEMQKKEAEE